MATKLTLKALQEELQKANDQISELKTENESLKYLSKQNDNDADYEQQGTKKQHENDRDDHAVKFADWIILNELQGKDTKQLIIQFNALPE